MDEPASATAGREQLLRDAPGALAHARARSMSERLELAVSWNSVATELRSGLAEVTGRAGPRV